MSTVVWGAVVGLLSGAASYWMTEFHFAPILHFRKLRTSVHADLIFFANAIDLTGMDKEMTKRVEDRMVANRRHSAELRAVFQLLPAWYAWLLKQKGIDVPQASKELIGLSNTMDHESASLRIHSISELLKVPAPT
jgi:hypothetical protein